MDYQSKTTVVMISVNLWEETTKSPLSSRFSAVHALATQIASHCQMDIMSIAPYSLNEAGEECCATVVYVNNGRSIEDIHRIMKPEVDNRTSRYWMILDIYEWQDMLQFMVSVKGTGDEWG